MRKRLMGCCGPSASYLAAMTEVHGHRGCNDGVPPNTVPAFLRAAQAGCHWLELDVVLAGDGQVLVSHEPWMDHETCLGPDGGTLTEGQGRGLNIFRMSLAEVQRYGVKPVGGEGATAPKPSLAEVVEAVRAWSDMYRTDAHPTSAAAMPMPGFNIEVKSDPAWYGTYQPPPAELAEAVLKAIGTLRIAGHCLVQCFDPAVLEAIHRRDPKMPLALLIDNSDGPQANLARLSFQPAYYSPSFPLVDGPLVQELRGRGIGLLAWTVNEAADMRRMILLGVDGLITDRPAAAMALLAGRA